MTSQRKVMKKILIVEDEEFVSMALRDSLESEGYKVDVVQDGEEVIGHIKKNIPDIILLDLLLPKRDGFSLLEEIKKNPEWKLIPIIVLSNLSDEQGIKRALDMGANDYFVKSQHSIEEILQKVGKILRVNKL